MEEEFGDNNGMGMVWKRDGKIYIVDWITVYCITTLEATPIWLIGLWISRGCLSELNFKKKSSAPILRQFWKIKIQKFPLVTLFKVMKSKQ